MKNKITVSEMAEVSMLVALSYTLSWIKPFRMPQGGSVSLEMLPIFLLSFRRGLKIGVIGGAVLGLLKLTLQMVVVHPAQLFLDYPAAFGALGISGLLKGKGFVRMASGIVLGSSLRFLFHLLSGAIFFAQGAGVKAWTASAIYNASYMIPSALLCLIFVPLIMRFASKR